jgi:hypothetical protein
MTIVEIGIDHVTEVNPPDCSTGSPSVDGPYRVLVVEATVTNIVTCDKDRMGYWDAQ